ncbi:MAG: hypothetical protein RLZZ416_204 [Candidatus Parcubacteria bacterium]|jgi:uncharacterized protein YkwD
MRKQRRVRLLSKILPRGAGARRSEALAAAAGSLLVICVFFASALDRAVMRSGQYASVVAAVLVDLANDDRMQENLDALTINPRLVAAAQAKADDMAAKSYFAHTSPEGVDPWHWFKEAGYSFEYAGENLAVDFSDSSDVNGAWMNSQTHRANILGQHFTEIGIATAEGTYEGHPTTFVVQEFGKPSRAAQAPVESTLPENPSQPALAAVAGASAAPLEERSGKPSASAIARVPNAPAPAGSLKATPDYAPWWQHLLASPKQFLHYWYFLAAFAVMAVLLFATGLELKWHHRRKAAAAGFVLVVVCALFVLGDGYVFPEPTLTAQAAQSTAAASPFSN